jgi:hypothetical protein
VPILARRWRKVMTTIIDDAVGGAPMPCSVGVEVENLHGACAAQSGARRERVGLHLAAEEATLDIIS